MLPDAVSAAVAGLVHPVRQPDGVAALDVIGGVCGQRRSRAVQTDKIARCLHSFEERPHDRRHLLLAEGKLLFLLHIVVYGELELLSLDDGQEHICFQSCLVLAHGIRVPVRSDRNASRLYAGIILLETLVLLRCQSAVTGSQDRKVNACALNTIPVDVAVVYAHINTLHILASKILVKIVSHGAVAMHLIAVPLAVRTYINVRVLMCRCDVGDATETDV